MTVDEAVKKLQSEGLFAKIRGDGAIHGGQGYEPPKPPVYIGVITGHAFEIKKTESGIDVRWISGPQQIDHKTVATFADAVQVIIENLPPKLPRWKLEIK